MGTKANQLIPSVNFHLWEPCNMRCKFCFATFQDVKRTVLPKGHLPREQAIEVVKSLADFGFEKITFAGGEPTLCKWLPDLITTAKDAGMTTMIVTNGSKITDEFLESNRNKLDWIAVSIDSINSRTNIETGRAISGTKPFSYDYYKKLVDRIKKYGYGLKINTVVTSMNYNENIADLINYAKPARWKVLQALPIRGQNDHKIDALTISEEEFKYFVDNHKELESITNIIPETNNDMKGSYIMVDPAGRFFDNSKGTHHYSKPIPEVGVLSALQQVNFDYSKFIKREGLYNWQKSKPFPTKITLSGCVGSGKTTVGKILASKLKYNFISIGNKTREIAENQGVSIVQFQEQCLRNPELDKKIDSEFSNQCNNSTNLIIDYRLGFKFVKDAYHIFLNISEETAIERIKKSNRENESFETINKRNESFKNQFNNTYGVDYTAINNYDLCVNVEEFKSAEDVVEYITGCLKISTQRNSNNL